ncbi:hypothetical protein GA0070616_4357 [Micromonospora nigra]|uniref:Uncharacterized protein n=1 Tax=Micromonospora nigra TaxID=145857 RepID=A0A1C6SRD9_9ACTN|nr:hypothetical protein [Micromonospora nigra]SCL31922.1 hypothetical protein GA0070616_4357 [Micromonospora nigra]
MAADPLWINESGGSPSYTAAELRRAQGVVLSHAGTSDRFGARSGVHPAGADALSLSGTTLTVQHLQAVAYPASSTTQGPYLVQLPSHTHTVPAASAQPRKDIVVLRVRDNDEDGSGERDADTVYLTGTAAGSPVEPSVPAGTFRLGTIDVPATGGGDPVLTYSAPFVVATGGILPVRVSGDLPTTGLHEGAYADRWDNDTLYRWSGSAWVAVASAAAYAAAFEPYALGYAGSGSNVTGITSTSFETGTSFGTSFVAPASGAVLITWGGLVRISATGDETIFLGMQVRDGNVVGSGNPIVTASDAETVRYRKPTTSSTSIGETQGDYHTRVTGLTAGAAYNVQLLHRVTAGTGTVSNRRVSITRWIA